MKKAIFACLACAVFIGFLRFIGMVIALSKSFFRHCCRRKQNLFERYGGEGTWALVTGATGGIGAAFCRQLARDGFNICLVSRTQSKLKALASELKQIAPGVKTRIVQADFFENSNPNFYKNIVRKVADLDIGFIVLNAGLMHVGYVETRSGKDLRETLDVNSYSLVILLKMLLPQLNNRCDSQKTSGVLATSSLAGNAPVGGNALYHSTKSFVSFLIEAVRYELENANSKVELYTLTPSSVDTFLMQ